MLFFPEIFCMRLLFNFSLTIGPISFICSQMIARGHISRSILNFLNRHVRSRFMAYFVNHSIELEVKSEFNSKQHAIFKIVIEASIRVDIDWPLKLIVSFISRRRNNLFAFTSRKMLLMPRQVQRYKEKVASLLQHWCKGVSVIFLTQKQFKFLKRF